ncbi:hypothetical protein D3C86_1821110 [compost metagenome]
MTCLRVRVSWLLDSAALSSFFSSLPPLGLSPSGWPGMPPICTGVAAPRLVPGAMAAIWLA